MFNVDDMFSKLVNNGTIPAYHPKIMALENELETNRKSKIEIQSKLKHQFHLLLSMELTIQEILKLLNSNRIIDLLVHI
jgi:hypothetical protein